METYIFLGFLVVTGICFYLTGRDKSKDVKPE